MGKNLTVVSFLLMISKKAFASGIGFTWSHFLLGWVEKPLVEIGIDPVPMLDLLIIAFLIVLFAYFAGKPFRKSKMLEPSGHSNLSNFAEVVVSLIFKL